MNRFQRENRILQKSRWDVVFNTDIFSIHGCDFDLKRNQWTIYRNARKSNQKGFYSWLLLATITTFGVGIVVFELGEEKFSFLLLIVKRRSLFSHFVLFLYNQWKRKGQCIEVQVNEVRIDPFLH